MRSVVRPGRSAARVRRYFVQSYPDRDGLVARLGFRRCHGRALDFVTRLDLPFDGATLVDVGCGDGEFLAELLEARGSPPSRLSVRIEDVNPRALRHAEARVAPLVGGVEAVLVGDDFETTRADVIMALGVLDYYVDWRHRLTLLAARAERHLVFTMPRRRLAGHVKRRLWLCAHGVSIVRVTRAELTEVERALPGQWHVEQDDLTFYCEVVLARHGI